MNANELKILNGLRTSADACFDDLKRLGRIERQTARDYRKFSQQAADLECASWRTMTKLVFLDGVPITHPACRAVQVEDAAMFEEGGE